MYHYFRDLLPLVIIGGSFALTGTVLFGAWLLGRYHGRDEALPAELVEVHSRLARMEYVIGQTNAALERLETAHRQTARLIADGPTDVIRLPGRHVTPH